MLHVPLVEAECKFINVATDVLLAGVVIDAIQAAVENGENALYAVSSHVIAGEFAFAVIDGLVIEKHAADARIGPGFVGM